MDDSNATRTIDLADIKDQCPLLLSTFQEVLRLRSYGAVTRVVEQDTVLDDQYLLKAGGVLQMPSRCINRETSTWGMNSSEFDPFRFISNGEGKRSNLASGFVSFGTSPKICPGRHFATGEILAAVAMLLVRYDMTTRNGHWIPPKRNRSAIAATISPPKEAFPVKVSVREAFRGLEWAFTVTEGKGKFPLITG